MKNTPLYRAALRGNLAAVKLLLDYGVDPNSSDSFEYTPLYEASLWGHIAVVKTFLAHPKIKVDAYDTIRMIPSLCAARTEIVKVLLSCGANAGFTCSLARDTPLHCAIGGRRPELARLLVNREDIDPNALSSWLTPLELAVRDDRQGLVEILLTDKRIKPDLTSCSLGTTPLFWAALKNNKAMADMLLSVGADKNLKHMTGLSPAMLLGVPSAETRYQVIQEHPLPDDIHLLHSQWNSTSLLLEQIWHHKC